MTAQKGKDLLLKLDSTGTGSFVTVAGLRSRSLSFNAQTIDVTNADSAGAWRELLGEAGIKSAALSGSGIFKDAATDATTRDFFFAGTIRDWQVILRKSRFEPGMKPGGNVTIARTVDDRHVCHVLSIPERPPRHSAGRPFKGE